MTPMTEPRGVLRAVAGSTTASFRRDYDTAASDLWSAITEPDRLARWLDPVTGDLRPGGRAEVHFDDGDSTFEIDICEPPRFLAVRWLHADRETTVTAEVRARGTEASTLLLEHAELTVEQAPMYAAGWHWHLDALGAVLAGEEPGSWSVFDDLLPGYRSASSALAR